MLAAIDGEDLGYGAEVVLRDVRFALAPGDRVALLGRSGSGKTTLLNTIYARLVAAGQRVALVPQDHALVPQLSVYHNVYMGRLEDRGAVYNLVNLVRPFAAELALIAPILDEVGLAGEARRRVEALSGGQKQRTALARAFFRGGDILLGDEPISAVDERQGAALLARIAARFATTVLAMHDVELALAHSTRVIGVREGRLVFDAAPAELARETIDALYRA